MERSRATAIAERGVSLTSLLADQLRLELSLRPDTNSGIAAVQWLGDAGARAVKRIAASVDGGDLIATGFRATPSRSRNPVLIDQRAFLQFNSSWLLNRLSFGRRQYEGVRLTRCADVPRISRDHHGSAKIRREQITTLISNLDRAKGISGMLAKQAVPIVRDAIANSGLKGVGTSNTSIERHMRLALGPKRKA